MSVPTTRIDRVQQAVLSYVAKVYLRKPPGDDSSSSVK